MKDKQSLMKSEEFEKALLDGAEFKKNIITSYKQQHKANFERFYSVMLDANPAVQKILETRKKNRSDSDKELVKKFKQSVAKTYNQVRDFLTPEDVEEGKMSKIEKLVEKISAALPMLQYLDSDILTKEFEKHGISIVSQIEYPEKLDNDDVKNNIKDIFKCAVNIKQKVEADNDSINDNIYATQVPIDLQYDKKLNAAGLKPGDFRKLVDIKTKFVMAKTKEAKEKIEAKAEKAAADKQFEVARAELVRDKLVELN